MRLKLRSQSNMFTKLSVNCELNYYWFHLVVFFSFVSKIITLIVQFRFIIKTGRLYSLDQLTILNLPWRAFNFLSKKNKDQLEFFPHFNPNQLPENKFIFVILSSIKPDEARYLVAQNFTLKYPVTKEDKGGILRW